MPLPRKQLIAPECTPYYHCVSRCVRRSFLCGRDDRGNNFEHRRQWIESRMLRLAEVFALDICAYAVMSNHYHVILHVDREKANGWSAQEVVSRWHQLFKGHSVSQRFASGQKLEEAEERELSDSIDLWRTRLSSISWFMRALNEPIARQANQEDDCTGRFWEGRFKSQALLDEKALMTCMAYVDLNPVRSRMAKKPEDSHYTSIKQRCQQAKKAYSPNHPRQQSTKLFPFVGSFSADTTKGLPFRLTEYLAVVDWSSRVIRAGKQGSLSSGAPILLERLQIDARHWLYCCAEFESRFKRLVGGMYALKKAAQALGYSRTPGLSGCSMLG